MVEVMEVPKGFKKTEVGIIPDDWDLKNIVENSTMKARIGWQGLTVAEYLNKGDYFLITGTDFVDGKIKWDTCHYVNKARYTQDKNIQVKIGDILITKDGTIGKVAYVDRLPLNATLNSGVFVIRPKENIYMPLFLFYIFNSFYFRDFLNNLVAGSTIIHLYQKDFVSFSFPLPRTKAEQTAIAEALNDADALIAKLGKLIAKKKAIKQGAMQELLKPKDGWEVKSLLELADSKKELFDDGDWIEAEHITNEGIRIIQTGNIGVGCYVEKDTKKYIYEKSFYKLKCKLLIEGDLLICRLADPAGRACVLPNIGDARIITSVDVTIFRPRKEVANRVFLANLFSTSNWFSSVTERVGGTTHKRISRSSLGKIVISLPNIDEQNRIAQILSDMDAEIESLEKKLDKYKMLKQGMMQNLLTGKIRLI